ncbi:hypothetical protein DYH09_13830 [bacterium CPR1]|nr:hypothetical protein [bacterium CPR1]
MTDTREMQEQILAYIRRVCGYVTYVELCNRIPGFSGGNHAVCAGSNPNIVCWTGLSDEGIQAILGLLHSGQVHHLPSSVLCYYVDGGALQFPLAKRMGPYKTPHWLPVTLNLGPGPTAKPKPAKRNPVAAAIEERAP